MKRSTLGLVVAFGLWGVFLLIVFRFFNTQPFAQVILWSVLVVLIVDVPVVVYASQAMRRAAALQASQPGSVAFNVIRSADLAKKLRDLEPPTGVTRNITLQADDRGISLWGGTAAQPRLDLTVPWPQTGPVSVGWVGQFGGRARCLVVPFKRMGVELDLPFILVSRSSGGVVQMGSTEADLLARRMESLRANALSR
jgi:hypothetical protein